MSVTLPFERVGHYRVVERIGRGGMGEIFLGRDERLDRDVAIKTISPALLPDENARRRFFEEARNAAGLSPPFICTVHEALEHEGIPLIVMEYVQGETVAQRVQAGPVPPHEISRIGHDVAEALAAAHARGIVHRDISASNVMIAVDGHAKVMDFGLARSVRPATHEDVTMTYPDGTAGLVVGTPAYLAPEVLRGERAGPLADLYSFGVVLYLMAVGRLPFVQDTPAELVAAILTRPPLAPRTLVPSLPWALNAVILKLLEKASSARFESAAAVAESLARRSGT